MTVTRRDMLLATGTAVAGTALIAGRSAAQDHSGHMGSMQMNAMPMAKATPMPVGPPPAVPHDGRYVPVRTLNG